MGINFKELKNSAENTEFTALPEDRYTLVIEAAQTAKNSKGNDMITVTYAVAEGKYKNRKLWTNFTITDKSKVYLFSLLKAIKSSLVDEEDAELEDIASGIIGGRCTAFVSIEMYDNKEKNTLSAYKAIEENESTNLFK